MSIQNQIHRIYLAGAIVNEQAFFNFACIRAIYAAAATGETQTVQRDSGTPTTTWQDQSGI